MEYSQTSDSGPSEIGTQYNKPLYKGRFSRSQIIGLPMVLIHFEPPRRGQPLYKGQKTWIYIVPLFGGLTVVRNGSVVRAASWSERPPPPPPPPNRNIKHRSLLDRYYCPHLLHHCHMIPFHPPTFPPPPSLPHTHHLPLPSILPYLTVHPGTYPSLPPHPPDVRDRRDDIIPKYGSASPQDIQARLQSTPQL